MKSNLKLINNAEPNKKLNTNQNTDCIGLEDVTVITDENTSNVEKNLYKYIKEQWIRTITNNFEDYSIYLIKFFQV